MTEPKTAVLESMVSAGATSTLKYSIIVDVRAFLIGESLLVSEHKEAIEKLKEGLSVARCDTCTELAYTKQGECQDAFEHAREHKDDHPVMPRWILRPENYKADPPRPNFETACTLGDFLIGEFGVSAGSAHRYLKQGLRVGKCTVCRGLAFRLETQSFNWVHHDSAGIAPHSVKLEYELDPTEMPFLKDKVVDVQTISGEEAKQMRWMNRKTSDLQAFLISELGPDDAQTATGLLGQGRQVALCECGRLAHSGLPGLPPPKAALVHYEESDADNHQVTPRWVVDPPVVLDAESVKQQLAANRCPYCGSSTIHDLAPVSRGWKRCGACHRNFHPEMKPAIQEEWLKKLEVPGEATSDYDRAIHRNPDAMAWARFFVETVQQVARKEFEKVPSQLEIKWEVGHLVLDESYMHGWFANAMMAMHDYLRSKNGPYEKDLRDERKKVVDLRNALECANENRDKWERKYYDEKDGKDDVSALILGMAIIGGMAVFITALWIPFYFLRR